MRSKDSRFSLIRGSQVPSFTEVKEGLSEGRRERVRVAVVSKEVEVSFEREGKNIDPDEDPVVFRFCGDEKE